MILEKSQIDFRSWLEEIEEYEPYRAQINNLAIGRGFPFRHWFPDEAKVYLPFIKMNFKEFLVNEIAVDDSQWQQTRHFVLKILDEFADGKQKFDTVIKLLDSLQHPALAAPVARLKSIYKNMSKTNIIPSMNSFYRVIEDIKNELQEMPSQAIGHKMFKKPRHSLLPI